MRKPREKGKKDWQKGDENGRNRRKRRSILERSSEVAYLRNERNSKDWGDFGW